MLELTADPTLVIRNRLGEGPIWDQDRKLLWWIDIIAGEVHNYDPQTGAHDKRGMPQRPTTLGLCSDGRLVATLAPGAKGEPACIALIDPDKSGLDQLALIEPDLPGNRPNDGKPGPDGRLWFGSMMNNLAPDGGDVPITGATGGLYSVDKTGEIVTHERDVGISNTFAWTAESDALITGDSMAGSLYRYPFDTATGRLGERAIFIGPDIHPGAPDGSAMGEDGTLWNARWDGAAVIGVDPAGKMVGRIAVPAARPTSCAFGGEDGKTLFITSSAEGLQGPRDGCLFAVQMPVGGVPVGVFEV